MFVIGKEFDVDGRTLKPLYRVRGYYMGCYSARNHWEPFEDLGHPYKDRFMLQKEALGYYDDYEGEFPWCKTMEDLEKFYNYLIKKNNDFRFIT